MPDLTSASALFDSLPHGWAAGVASVALLLGVSTLLTLGSTHRPQETRRRSGDTDTIILWDDCGCDDA